MILISLFGLNIEIMIEADTVTRKIPIVKATTSIESSFFERFIKVFSSSADIT